jgi:hypothetical protein
MGGVIPDLLAALAFVKERSSSNDDSIMVKRCIQMHKKTHHSENVSGAVRVLAPLLVDLCRMPKEPSTTSSYSGHPAEASVASELIDPLQSRILEAAKAVRLPAITMPSLLHRCNQARGRPGNIPKDEMRRLHMARREGVVFDTSLYMDVSSWLVARDFGAPSVIPNKVCQRRCFWPMCILTTPSRL